MRTGNQNYCSESDLETLSTVLFMGFPWIRPVTSVVQLLILGSFMQKLQSLLLISADDIPKDTGGIMNNCL